MATGSAITAALAAAQALAITSAQMYALIDQVIANGLVDDGNLILGTSGDGTSITMAWETAMAFRVMYRQEAYLDAGGFVVQNVEF